MFSSPVNLALGAVVIALAVLAITRRVDVRLALFCAAMALGFIAANPWPIVQTFFRTFANERFVVPICCAMGFAYTLRHTGCDQHLVHLLVKPLTKVRWLLIPGAVVVGFIVNIPIISQTSTVASIGPVVIPILTAARLKPVTIGAVLLLGCSVGGELLNPGAPELRTIVEETRKLKIEGAKSLSEHVVVQRILPLNLIGLAVATTLFWFISARAEARTDSTTEVADSRPGETPKSEFNVNYVKAAIPFVPLFLLFLTGPPLNLVKVPPQWLVKMPMQTAEGIQFRKSLTAAPQAGFPAAVPWSTFVRHGPPTNPPRALSGLYNSRLIGLAMLIGVVVAAAVSYRSALQTPRHFFEGAGYAFANIVSLIVTASCFGEGIKQIGLAKMIGDVISLSPYLLFPASGALPVCFAALSGSGMATTQSLFGFYAPAAGEHSLLVGAVVSLGSAAGRTMSPVAAVCLMSSTLTGTNPFALSKRVALPLIAGVVAIVIAAFVIAQS